MVDIIPPIPKEAVMAELTHDKFVRKTNYAGNEIYVFTHHDSPNLMCEVGRLRELTFRHAGGGSNKETDVDEFDYSDDPYHQLIVWDPQHKEILGGYRFYIPLKGAIGAEIIKKLSTSHYFNFSKKFSQEYLPYIIELGRSFVQPVYQSTNRARKGIYALDNLWDGLGALKVDNPDMKYFFGKVTMYTQFNKNARNLILYFLKKHFGDTENLLSPINPLNTEINEEEMHHIFKTNDYQENYRILSKKVRGYRENIPPLINAYMNLSPTMKTFGTTMNHEFGNVEETAIMITNADLFESKVERHVNTYKRINHYLKKRKFFY
jgi:hypothetical protein